MNVINFPNNNEITNAPKRQYMNTKTTKHKIFTKVFITPNNSALPYFSSAFNTVIKNELFICKNK